MTEPKDIVERLATFHREIVESDGAESEQMKMTREAMEEIQRLRLLNRDTKAALKFAGNMTQAVQVFFAEMIDNL